MPSMLMVIAWRFRVSVKSSLVNWLPPLSRGQALVGIEDLRPAVLGERFLECLDTELRAERVRQLTQSMITTR